MAVCNNCGTQNSGKARFCVSCGNDLSQQSSAPASNPQSFSSTSNSGSPAQKNACLWCHETRGFTEEEGKLDSKWGVTAHKVKIFICNNCGYAHLFGLGRTIWDFD